jgi:uncharacterized protein YcnI
MKAFVLVSAGALVFTSSAWAHANISPPVALAKHDQVFTLAVPTEKSVATTKVELDVPAGFAIDSFVPAPGWKRINAVMSGSPGIRSVTWAGGSVPTGEDAAFSFLAGSDSAKTLAFTVKQTYADGSVVTWSGPESSDTPAPAVEFRSSFGGGSSTLGVIALVVAAVALVVAVAGLLARAGGGRPLT